MRLSLLQRLTALMLLMAYTVTGTSVMPAMMALAAWMDGEHEVVISQSESGTSVTLHHVEGSYTPDVEDHQKMLGKFLVSFCRAAVEGDHQMKASRCDSRTGTTTLCKCMPISVCPMSSPRWALIFSTTMA